MSFKMWGGGDKVMIHCPNPVKTPIGNNINQYSTHLYLLLKNNRDNNIQFDRNFRRVGTVP